MKKSIGFREIICIISVFTFLHKANAYDPKQGNIWYFGLEAGINFNTIPATPLTDGLLTTWDNSTAIADYNGNLLFYSNGETVWNKNHQVMSNGTGLAGSTTGGQCAMIVPQPESSLYYYIFTTSEFASGAGFCYSKVDKSQQSGLGAVFIKNQPLITPATEKMACIYNFSDGFWWVLAHEWSTNNFRAYRLSAFGLDTIPVVSSVGAVHTGGSYGYSHNAMGQMNFSPDGSKIALALYMSGISEIFDFDMSTGIVSNPITINTGTGSFGVEFCPNGRKMYTSKLYGSDVYQYDLSVFNQAAISASSTLIGTIPPVGGYAEGYLQLAPDGKIYLAYDNTTSLAVIDQPDLPGTACDFIGAGFSLAGKHSRVGLCNYIFRQNLVPTVISDLLLSNELIAFPNPTNGYLTLSATESELGNFKFEIIDAVGRIVENGEINFEKYSKINMSDFPNGVYTIFIEDNRKKYSLKLIKN